jgi:hypothetical protein
VTTRLEERRAVRAGRERRRIAVLALLAVFTATLAVAISFGVSVAPRPVTDPGCCIPAERQPEPPRTITPPLAPPVIPDIVPDDAELPCEPYCPAGTTDPGK